MLSSSQPEHTKFATQRILLIEDEPEVAQVIQLMLGTEGYDVVWRERGIDGLAAAAALQPDAIVLDLCLQDMDGARVLRQLRNDPATCHTPIIIASAMTHRLNDADSHLALRVLPKPFGLDDLLAAVGEAVAKV